MIKYLGSKRTLLPTLVGLLDAFPELTSIADVFSGTSRVGHAFKGAGWRVEANDHNAYAATLARCYVQSDDTLREEALELLSELNSLPGQRGYFTETFCEQSRFFKPENGERVDAIRESISERSLSEELKAIVYPGAELVYDRSKPDGMPRRSLDVGRLNQLGWSHRTDLATGLVKTYSWYLDRADSQLVATTATALGVHQ